MLLMRAKCWLRQREWTEVIWKSLKMWLLLLASQWQSLAATLGGQVALAMFGGLGNLHLWSSICTELGANLWAEGCPEGKTVQHHLPQSWGRQFPLFSSSVSGAALCCGESLTWLVTRVCLWRVFPPLALGMPVGSVLLVWHWSEGFHQCLSQSKVFLVKYHGSLSSFLPLLTGVKPLRKVM